MINQVQYIYPDYNPVNVNLPAQQLGANFDYAMAGGGAKGGFLALAIYGVAEIFTKNRDEKNKKIEKDPRVQSIISNANYKINKLYNELPAKIEVSYVRINDWKNGYRGVHIPMVLLLVIDTEFFTLSNITLHIL